MISAAAHQSLPSISATASTPSNVKDGETSCMHPDAMREIRCMSLAALPCPPMLVMVCRELAGECGFVEQETQCCSSHDLIAHLMSLACALGTEKQSSCSAMLQKELHASLFRQVDEWQEQHDPHCLKCKLPPMDWTYQVLGEFTRNYIRSYMPDPSKQQDVWFLPYEDIDLTHFVHAKALEFQKARSILYGACRMPHRDLDRMSYAELLQLSVQRIMESHHHA